MKLLSRFGLFGLFTGLASTLAGCPIFDEEGEAGYYGCQGDDCGNPGPECLSSDECGLNETCGADEKCHTGDCTHWGCATGECVIGEDDTATCEGGGSSSGSGGSGGQGGAGGAGGAGGGPDVIYCGNPDDCAIDQTCGPEGICEVGDCTMVDCIFGFACDTTAVPPVCKPENPAACGADADCLIAGYACVSGICTAPEDQCFDQGQCDGGGKCAEGKCTASCSDSSDCPTGYACDTGLGLCSEPAQSCAITNDCGGPDLVCVDGACVPRSVGGTCEDPDAVWVENGCVPDQKASFTCTVDGTQDACAAGSICLHHSCYISCAAPNQSACDNLPTLNICKSVTTSSGSHDVCGSNSNLGDECDPQAGEGCAAGTICVDGYCK